MKKNLKLGVLFLPPSDAYVRSFLYLLYTLIKLKKKKKNLKVTETKQQQSIAKKINK